MNCSYLKNCYIKRKDNDLNIITGDLQDDGTLTNVMVQLDGYSIIPTSDYLKLEAISEKVVTKIAG